VSVRFYPALGTTANLTVRKVTAALPGLHLEPMALDIPNQPAPAPPPASEPAPRNTISPVSQTDIGRDNSGDSSTDDESDRESNDGDDDGDGNGGGGEMRLPGVRLPGMRGFRGVPRPADRGVRAPPPWLSQETHVRRAASQCMSA